MWDFSTFLKIEVSFKISLKKLVYVSIPLLCSNHSKPSGLTNRDLFFTILWANSAVLLVLTGVTHVTTFCSFGIGISKMTLLSHLGSRCRLSAGQSEFSPWSSLWTCPTCSLIVQSSGWALCGWLPREQKQPPGLLKTGPQTGMITLLHPVSRSKSWGQPR